MRRIISALAFALVAGSFLHVNSAVDSSCLAIDSPRQGTIVTTPLCTVAVTACDQVSAISFTAHFIVADAKGDTSLFLGRITHGPFKLIWNTDAVPNQLYKGMSFSADALLRSGERISRTVGGVFIANKPVVHAPCHHSLLGKRRIPAVRPHHVRRPRPSERPRFRLLEPRRNSFYCPSGRACRFQSRHAKQARRSRDRNLH